MPKEPALPAKTDHLKYYCIVFGILVIVIENFVLSGGGGGGH